MRNEKGFTVLELVFVIVIGAIVGAIAVHGISSAVPGKQLSGATLAFQSDLNQAKMKALKNGKQCKVTVSGSDYTLFIGDAASGSSTWTTDSTASLPYTDITFETSENFIFYPRGTANQTAVVLTNSEGNTRTITVTLAGRIRSS